MVQTFVSSYGGTFDDQQRVHGVSLISCCWGHKRRPNQNRGYRKAFGDVDLFFLIMRLKQVGTKAEKGVCLHRPALYQ